MTAEEWEGFGRLQGGAGGTKCATYFGEAFENSLVWIYSVW